MKHFITRLIIAFLLLGSSPAWAASESSAGASSKAAGPKGPRVAITAPSASGAHTSQAPKTALAGSIDTRLPIQSVRWVNSLGGQGVAKPKTDRLKNIHISEKVRWLAQGTGRINWQTPQLELKPGVNIITVTATNLFGHSGTAVININYQTENRPVVFAPSTDTTINTLSIGVAGGVIEATTGPTAIRGTKVTFPAGALPSNTTVSIGYNPGQLTPNQGEYAGAALVVNTGAITQFSQPVTITAPLTDSSTLPVPYYLDPQGKLHLAQLTGIDRAAHTFSFQTFHASWYAWIINRLPGNSDLIRTEYTPAAHGFQIPNPPSIRYFDGGICFGMTAFSLWYHQNAQSSKGNFYPKYMSPIGTDSNGATLNGQQVIASRAFVSIGQHYSSYYRHVFNNEMGLSQADRFSTIENAMANTAEPVLIMLDGNPDAPGTGHSVLAYKLSRLLGNISVYDPNYPGQENTISYDPNSKQFGPYRGFYSMTFGGNGSLRVTEPYQHILDDAEAGFHSSTDAKITVTHPTNGEHVTDRTVTLRGKIQSGQVLATKLTVFVGPANFSTNLRTDGNFNLPISLQSGVNQLEFRVEGQDDNGQKLELENDLTGRNFSLVLDEPKAVMLVTLTWDTADTDVDLYVTDPASDTSWYADRVTADGARLDHDITTGYGPEHWTLLSTNNVRYNQPYRVRLHYYSDHGRGPTNYTVTTTLYEGTSRKQTKTYRGNLATANSRGNAPGSTGPDWVDIANVTLQPATP